MEDEVWFVFQSRLPPAFVDNNEVPLQLFTTFTLGVGGTGLGAVVTEVLALIQPFSMAVTLYVALSVTINTGKLEPLLQVTSYHRLVTSKVNPHELITATGGAAGISLTVSCSS